MSPAPEMRFVNLHGHSTFSFKDGYGLPAEHVERVANLGMSALALTEHGNPCSHVKLQTAARAAGVTPLFGCELYTAPRLKRRKWHLTTIAETTDGYRNLMRLITKSFDPVTNFYQFPTVHGEDFWAHADGIIALSGCVDSKLACDLLGGKGVDFHEPDLAAARRTVAKFRDLLGDRYYLEVQVFPELERTRNLNPIYAQLSRELDVPLAATCDVHYPLPDDNELQKVLHTVGRGLGTVDTAESEWEYNVKLTYPTSDAMVAKRLMGTGLSRREAHAAIAATHDIAARARVELPRAPDLAYPTEHGQSAQELIWEQLRKGWNYRIKRSPALRARTADARDQLRREMAVIGEVIETFDRPLHDYLLVVGEAVRWAKRQGIATGPARGSAAASIVCWLLRITEVFPLDFPTMMFERFIDVSRDDMPDIDLDFDDERRHELTEHLVELYGAAMVGSVANFVQFRGKTALNDVGVAYGLPFGALAPIKDVLADRPEGDERFANTIEDTVAMFPKAAAAAEANPEAVDVAQRLEGNVKAIGTHAAGVVVATVPLATVAATFSRTVGKDKRRVETLAYDKRDAEALGLLKLDFLGLKTMGTIGGVLDEVGMTLPELYALPHDDPAVYDGFCAGDTIGIFQWDGATTARINTQVQPRTIHQLADINALSRPGPLESGAVDRYIAAKRTGVWVAPHEIVREHTAATFGEIVYQEQALAIVRDLGNFDAAQVGTIRRIIGKKKSAESFNALRADFVSGAATHDCDDETANAIFSSMVSACRYSFNIAHSASYAVLAYWTMYLKLNHPAAFFAHSMRKTDESFDVARLARDAARHDVRVIGPDLNESGATWRTLDERTVLSGFAQVDGIAEKTAAPILEARAAAGFWREWADVGRVKGVGPVTVRKLEAAAESQDPAGIKNTAHVIGRARRHVRLRGLARTSEHTPEVPLFGSDDWPSGQRIVAYTGIVTKVDVRDIVEDEHRRTGDAPEAILADLKDPELRLHARIACVDDGDHEVSVRINRWTLPRIEATVNRLQAGDLILAVGKSRGGFYRNVTASKLVRVAKHGTF